jgi:hypothetical protein
VKSRRIVARAQFLQFIETLFDQIGGLAEERLNVPRAKFPLKILKIRSIGEKFETEFPLKIPEIRSKGERFKSEFVHCSPPSISFGFWTVHLITDTPLLVGSVNL